MIAIIISLFVCILLISSIKAICLIPPVLFSVLPHYVVLRWVSGVQCGGSARGGGCECTWRGVCAGPSLYCCAGEYTRVLFLLQYCVVNNLRNISVQVVQKNPIKSIWRFNPLKTYWRYKGIRFYRPVFEFIKDILNDYRTRSQIFTTGLMFFVHFLRIANILVCVTIKWN